MQTYQAVKNNLVAIIFIGTNRYLKFFPKYRKTIKEHFLPETHKEFFVFTNDVARCERWKDDYVHIQEINNDPWPFPTLMRFKYMNSIAQELKRFSHVIFIDADMYAHKKITEEEFFNQDKKFFAVEHPAFVYRTGTFETREESLACVDLKKDDLTTYHQACFFGGRSADFLEMIAELERRVDDDLSRDVIALWHDESHVNKYFAERADQVHTLDPGYAYVDYFNYMTMIEKKFIHINKKGLQEEDMFRWERWFPEIGEIEVRGLKQVAAENKKLQARVEELSSALEEVKKAS